MPNGSYGARLGTDAGENLAEVRAEEPVTCTRYLMERGVRYVARLVDAVLDDDVPVEVAVPDVDRYCNVCQTKTPRPLLQLDVLDRSSCCCW